MHGLLPVETGILNSYTYLYLYLSCYGFYPSVDRILRGLVEKIGYVKTSEM